MVKRGHAMSILVALLVMLGLTAGLQAEPMTMDNVRELRRHQKSHDEIVTEARNRGVAFELDNATVNQLRRMRFTNDQIDALRTIQSGGGGGEAQQQGGEQQAGERSPSATCGPRMPNTWQERQKKILEEAVAGSGLNLTAVEAGHFLLVGTPQTVQRHVDDAVRLQQILARTYGGVFASGLDIRSAHIVMLDNQQAYERFINALFQAMENNNQRVNPEFPGMARNAGVISLRTTGVVNLGRTQLGENSRRAVVSLVGRMLMLQLTDGRATDAMTNGFANVCEVIIFRNPLYTFISYESRAIARADNWAAEMQKRVREGELARPSVVLQNYSTSNMTLPQYIESWSLMSLLSQGHQQFQKFVVEVRDAPEDTPIMQSLERAYEMNEQRLYEGWAQSIGG